MESTVYLWFIFIYLLFLIFIEVLATELCLHSRLTETLFVTQLTKGGAWDFQNKPPYDAYFGASG